MWGVGTRGWAEGHGKYRVKPMVGVVTIGENGLRQEEALAMGCLSGGAFRFLRAMRLGAVARLSGSHGERSQRVAERVSFKLAGVAPETVPRGPLLRATRNR